MANLSTILRNRVPQSVLAAVASEAVETNLTGGQVWAWSPGGYNGNQVCGFCWFSPGAGTAVIEIWGAGGSGVGGCCCFGGIPGNPGAYAKRTITVASGDFVCGFAGTSCGNITPSFRGCSTATCVTICKLGVCCVCMCAQGGAGGLTICQTGTSQYCCMVGGLGLPGTLISNGCGIACNACRQAVAFGGDINCSSCASCTTFWICNPTNSTNVNHIAYPPGIFSTNGGWISYLTSNCYTDNQFTSIAPFSQALTSMNSRTLGFAQGAMLHCWNGGMQCGCYTNTGCTPTLPYGFPGASSAVTGGQQGYGQRGGHGAIRITFVGS